MDFPKDRYDFHLKRFDQIVTGTTKTGATIFLALALACGTSLYAVAEKARALHRQEESLRSIVPRLEAARGLMRDKAPVTESATVGNKSLDGPPEEGSRFREAAIIQRKALGAQREAVQERFAKISSALSGQVEIPVINQKIPVPTFAAPSMVGALLLLVVAYFFSARRMALRELRAMAKLSIAPPLPERMRRQVVTSPTFWIAPLPERLTLSSPSASGRAPVPVPVDQPTLIDVPETDSATDVPSRALRLLGWRIAQGGRRERSQIAFCLLSIFLLQGWLTSLSLTITRLLGSASKGYPREAVVFTAIQAVCMAATGYVAWLWLGRHRPLVGPEPRMAVRRVTRRRFVQVLGSALASVATTGLFSIDALAPKGKRPRKRRMALTPSSNPDGLYQRPVPNDATVHWVVDGKIQGVGNPYSRRRAEPPVRKHKPLDLSGARPAGLAALEKPAPGSSGKGDPHLVWSVYSRCLEGKACDALNRGDHKRAIRALQIAIKHDKRNPCRRQPNARLYDLMALVLAKHDRKGLRKFAEETRRLQEPWAVARADKWLGVGDKAWPNPKKTKITWRYGGKDKSTIQRVVFQFRISP